MWKDKYNTYGFKVTFNPESSIKGVDGMVPLIQMFGTKDRDTNFESLDIDYELSSLGICVDYHPTRLTYVDFEGFEFTDNDGNVETLSPDCSGDFEKIDLTDRKLIGFKVVVSDFIRERRNIRTICPIVHNNEKSELKV